MHLPLSIVNNSHCCCSSLGQDLVAFAVAFSSSGEAVAARLRGDTTAYVRLGGVVPMLCSSRQGRPGQQQSPDLLVVQCSSPLYSSLDFAPLQTLMVLMPGNKYQPATAFSAADKIYSTRQFMLCSCSTCCHCTAGCLYSCLHASATATAGLFLLLLCLCLSCRSSRSGSSSRWAT